MLLTKIRYSYDVWKNNRVNYRADDLHIDLIEADGLKPTYSQSDRDNGINVLGRNRKIAAAGCVQSFADVAECFAGLYAVRVKCCAVVYYANNIIIICFFGADFYTDGFMFRVYPVLYGIFHNGLKRQRRQAERRARYVV